MFIRCTHIGAGPGPSEEMVSVVTSSGVEEIILSRMDLEGDQIDVGNPLDFDKEKILVELPRETASGKWRVWVPETETIQGLRQAAE